MNDEIFFIVITAIIFGTVMIASIFKSVFRYAGGKTQAPKLDASLTTSELQGLIRDAVTEATEPLNERIAMLEQRLDTQQHDLLTGTDGYLTEASNTPERQPVR